MTDFLKSLKGYRTYIVAAVLAFFGALESANWVQLLPPEWERLGLVVIPAVFAALRAITTTPPGRPQ